MSKTPFERKGFKANDVFVVTRDEDICGKKIDPSVDIAILKTDDGSVIPLFDVGHQEYGHCVLYIRLNHLRKIGTL